MSTKQVFEEIQKMSPEERAEIEALLSRLKVDDVPDARSHTFGDLVAELTSLAQQIPEEERSKIPHDGAHNHDHYLYGSPKR